MTDATAPSNDRRPVQLRIGYNRQKHGTFILNGMDITHRVSGCTVEITARKIAMVTFSMFVDELDADIEGEGEELPE